MAPGGVLLSTYIDLQKTPICPLFKLNLAVRQKSTCTGNHCMHRYQCVQVLYSTSTSTTVLTCKSTRYHYSHCVPGISTSNCTEYLVRTTKKIRRLLFIHSTDSSGTGNSSSILVHKNNYYSHYVPSKNWRIKIITSTPVGNPYVEWLQRTVPYRRPYTLYTLQLRWSNKSKYQ